MSAHPALELEIRLPLDRFKLAVSQRLAARVTGVFGPSGAGKSSLLEAVAGLRRAEGRIAFGDQIWLDSAGARFAPPEARDVGYVPQEGLLFPHWSVRRNLLAARRRAERAGQPPERLLARIAELLELGPLLHRQASSLSGGERQRVALGRALCSGARLLLLDEPLAALDLPLRRRLLPLLARIRNELTVPLVLVSHDPIEVQALCDEVLVLRDGEVLARGEPRRVLTDPSVFPLAEREGFENLLPGRLERREGGADVVRLAGDSAPEVVVVPEAEAAGGPVLLGLAASQILIATELPRGLSARNAVPAEVREIRALERYTLVTAVIADSLPLVTVEVTGRTPAELDLEPGRPVFLVFKATSCRLYGGASPPA